MPRLCTCCGTPLPGRKGHGWVKTGAVVCGRTEIQVTRVNAKGERFLARVPAPSGCRA
jgi:hypothetical protein